MSREARTCLQFLQDIIQACERIEKFTSGMEYEDFVANDMAYDAVLRNLEVIGEAVTCLPVEITLLAPEIQWNRIRGLRNRLAHAYFGISDRIIWDLVINKIPTLDLAVKNIFKNHKLKT